jgi:integrase
MSVRKRDWTTAKGEAKTAWVVDYADVRGKRRLKTFTTKKKADAFAATAHLEVREGTHIADSESATVTEAGALWISAKERDGLERSTLEQYRQHVDFHISPLVGETRLTMLSVPTVRKFEEDLLDAGKSPALTKKALVSLGSLLADAQERGLVSRNVVRDMRKRRGTSAARVEKRAKGKLKVGVDIPSPGEVRAIISVILGRWRAAILLLTFGGLRASELRGLTWDALDFAAGRVRIYQRADRFKAIGKPKSEAGDRTLPLPPLAINALKEWKLAAGPSTSGLVFPDGADEPIAHRTIADAFMAAQLRAGVTNEGPDETRIAKYTGLHALRHFYASWCINRKIDGGLELLPKTVQERLGHSSITLTLDTYGHLFPSADDGQEMAAAEALFLAR